MIYNKKTALTEWVARIEIDTSEMSAEDVHNILITLKEKFKEKLEKENEQEEEKQ